jgi:hypothetical protein
MKLAVSLSELPPQNGVDLAMRRRRRRREGVAHVVVLEPERDERDAEWDFETSCAARTAT